VSPNQQTDCAPREPLHTLDLAHLMALALHCRKYFSDPYLLAYGVATNLVKYYLGDEWNDIHVHGKPARAGMRHPRNRKYFTDVPPGKGKELYDRRYQMRVTALAERLYKFQAVPGIEHRRKMLQTENVETALGELDCASIIAMPGFNFRFVVPTGNKGSDYEAEVTTPAGRTVFCEIKTKRESTPMSQKTVWNTLENARKQLPEDQPGMVLFKAS
jgi:hypothetical protein